MLREVTIEDIDQVYNIEKECFLIQEAASYQSLKERLEVGSDNYYFYIVNHHIVGYIGGLQNDEYQLSDEMYGDASLHHKDGNIQTIFSVAILKEYRNQGYGEAMVKEYRDLCIKKGRQGIILTCKDELIPFYQRCGFARRGRSLSNHGGASWNDMIYKNM